MGNPLLLYRFNDSIREKTPLVCRRFVHILSVGRRSLAVTKFICPQRAPLLSPHLAQIRQGRSLRSTRKWPWWAWRAVYRTSRMPEDPIGWNCKVLGMKWENRRESGQRRSEEEVVAEKRWGKRARCIVWERKWKEVDKEGKQGDGGGMGKGRDMEEHGYNFAA